MGLGVICCKVMEREIRAVIDGLDDITRLEVMDWGLHTRPDLLLESLTEKITALEDEVDAVVLGYGRCQTMDRLPRNFKVPVFRPQAEDCIGVLMGQDRYEAALKKEAGTWFFTPGWTEMGMEFIFRELQLDQLVAKWADDPNAAKKDPMELARRMLKDYTRALLIDTGVGDRERLRAKAEEISSEFNFRLESSPGSLDQLRDVFRQARLAVSTRSHRPG